MQNVFQQQEISVDNKNFSRTNKKFPLILLLQE